MAGQFGFEVADLTVQLRDQRQECAGIALDLRCERLQPRRANATEPVSAPAAHSATTSMQS
ncbi:hypothetical protein [Rhodococcus sp. PvP104]|jgi:hypothetical protein|uniref:hypothetical protein n=1 Tax=Rhodococcus sp. PvP104 TaxID=2817911 RepID=UPI001AE27B25|nr:hypothetical protein [Rhodococcus sp. PvP104]MBP2527213.1 hypothetical protein [Rhodococcus sp. PvP104]